MTNNISLPMAMTSTEAQQVTARIKLLLTTITETTEKVVTLIDAAKTGRAWSALGYDNWPAYVAGEYCAALAGLARAERIPIVEKLSITGMSTRAIASVAGVSQPTVVRDLQVIHDVSPGGETQTHVEKTTTGTDGKTYVRNGRPTSTGIIAITETAPAPTPKRRRPPLPDTYWRAVLDLRKVLERLEWPTADDRFPGQPGRSDRASGDDLDLAAARLHDVRTALSMRHGASRVEDGAR